MSPPRLNLIGAGRVGRTLAQLWQACGVLQVQDVLTRSADSAQAAVAQIGAGRAVSALSDMAAADIWLIATPDTALAATAAALAQAQAQARIQPQHQHQHRPQSQNQAHGPHGLPEQSVAPGPMAWHCSGFWPASVLQPLADCGWRLASAHPAMSFANPEVARVQFSGTACALEGDSDAVALARQAFSAIGGHCFDLHTDDKLRYHAAAVLASNFTPVLQAAAAELWQSCGMPPALVTPLWQGFVRHVADNLIQLGPQGALTGPAARGDDEVVRLQTQALLARDPALGQAYAALSTLAGRLARDGRVLPPAPDAAHLPASPTHGDPT